VKRKKAAHPQNVKISGRQSSQGGIRESAEVQSKSNVWLALLCALVGVGLYLNTLHHDFVLDDVGTVTGHPYVMQGWRGIPKIFQVGLWQFDNVNLGYYRPLSLVTFAIENQFFPKNAYVGHLDNVLLYGLTGFCLYLLLTRIFRGMYPLFSLSVTLLFLAPPIHAEVVANIKSRDEILAFLSLILSLLFFLRHHALQSRDRRSTWRRWHGLLISGTFFHLALLSKETAMTGVILMPLTLYFVSRPGRFLLHTRNEGGACGCHYLQQSRCGL